MASSSSDRSDSAMVTWPACSCRTFGSVKIISPALAHLVLASPMSCAFLPKSSSFGYLQRPCHFSVEVRNSIAAGFQRAMKFTHEASANCGRTLLNKRRFSADQLGSPISPRDGVIKPTTRRTTGLSWFGRTAGACGRAIAAPGDCANPTHR